MLPLTPRRGMAGRARFELASSPGNSRSHDLVVLPAIGDLWLRNRTLWQPVKDSNPHGRGARARRTTLVLTGCRVFVGIVVGEAGLEPALAAFRTRAADVYRHSPVRWLGRRGSNPHDDLRPRQVAFRLAHVPLGCPSSNALDSRGPQPRALLSSSGHTSWSTPRGSNPDEAACRAAALPLVLGVGGSGPGSRTPLGSVMSRPRPRGVRNGLGGAGGSRTRTPRSRTASTHRYCDSAGMVDPEGIEPSSPGCKPGILPVERRAHCGEDNGTRTRTLALTTRRLALRLCPHQSGPGGGIRTHMCTGLKPVAFSRS